MPWATVLQPSIQLGILAARLARAGIEARCLYANIEYARRVGPANYERYGTYDSLFSQWVFSESLFGHFSPRPAPSAPADFYEYAARRGVDAEQLDELRRVTELTTRFIGWCLDAVDWQRARVVGFTTTLLQTMPALALARHLKERYPHLRILFGGAGCHGSMGRAVHRNFPFVDGVVDAEADLTIVPMTTALLRGEDPSHVPGLLWRRADGSVSEQGVSPASDMRDYPRPLYDDFFAQLGDLAQLTPVRRVPFEASRGCWWAKVSQCKFCGLNGELLAQRSRDVDEVVEELRTQQEHHGARFFLAMDNIIAPPHVTKLAKALSAGMSSAEFFFEARVVMQRRHMEGLARAGIVHIQAGVESLIAEVLAMTDKGTRPSDNVCFLRRCLEFRVRPYWNMLYGFPGEEERWYEELLACLEQFFHLPAPDIIPFSLQRFSPYFDAPARYGISVLGPQPGSEYVWNLPEAEIRELSFELAFKLPQSWDMDRLKASLQQAVHTWRARSAVLEARLIDGARVAIHDTRSGQVEDFVLTAAEGRLLRALESPLPWRKAAVLLERHPAGEERWGAEEPPLLEGLVRRRLVYRDADRLVALVVPTSERFWLEDSGLDTAPAPHGFREAPPVSP